MLRDLVLKCRSYRRFHEEIIVNGDMLLELVDLARNSASARNLQPLKYVLCCSIENNALIFPCLRWAAALKDWHGPEEGERPSAYIIMLGDKELSANFGIDPGIAAQSILLGAVEKGLGGCMLANVDKPKLRELFAIEERYEILLVIALGKPKEEVVLEVMEPADPYAYWRDEKRVHHVPKRRLDDIIIDQL